MANADSQQAFDWRDLWGFGSVLVGVVAIVGVLWLLVSTQKSQSDITAILGVVVSPIVAIVSAYFGISVATKGTGQALSAQKGTSDAAMAQISDATNKAIAGITDAGDKAYRAALAVDPGSDGGKKLVG